jgi:hypothetical protein
MSWGFVAVAGATLVSGALSSQSARDAARAQGRAGDAAIDEQRRQFDIATEEQRRQQDQLLQLTANQRGIGNQALNALGASFGYSPAPGYGPAGSSTYADPVTQQLNQRMNGPRQYDNDELVLDRGGIPAVNAQLYATDPVYRQAWDATLASERAGPLWRNQGASTYYARATDQDWTRLNELMARNIAQFQGQQPTSGNHMQPVTVTNGGVPVYGFGTTGQPGQPGTGQPGQANPVPPTSPLSRPPTSPLDPNGFTASPDYAFRRGEGMRGIEGSFSARGGAQSGNALRALTEFNSNLASGEYGNWFQRQQSEYDRWFNRNAALAGIGQTATNQAGSGALQTGQGIAGNAMQTGSNIGNALIGQGDARASGIIGGANAWGNAAQDLAGLYGYWQMGRNPPQNSGWSGPR